MYCSSTHNVISDEHILVIIVAGRHAYTRFAVMTLDASRTFQIFVEQSKQLFRRIFSTRIVIEGMVAS